MPSTTSTTRPRDLRFDTLRGLLVLFMAMNHIETDVRVVTSQSLGYVSSAEGFVFISGLIAGWIYSRKLHERGPDAARTAMRRRAGEVYRMHLLTYLATFVWMVLFVLMTTNVPHLLPWAFAAEPWKALVLGPALLYQPGLLDILPMYCVFLLVLPPVLRAVAAGRSALVLMISLTLWAVAQFMGGPIRAFGGLVNLGAFNILAWQLLFIGGAVLGGHKALGQRLMEPRAGVLAAVFVVAIYLALVRHGVLAAPLAAEQMNELVRKPVLAPLRLLNFALVAYLVGAGATLFPRAFSWRPLALLGQHTLSVFSAHVVVAMVILTYPELFFYTPAGRWTATGAMLFTLFATALVSRWRRDREIRRAIVQLTRSAPPPTRPDTGWIAAAR